MIDEFGRIDGKRIDAAGVHAAGKDRERPARPRPQPLPAIDRTALLRRRHAHHALAGHRLELVELDDLDERGMDAGHVVALDEVVGIGLPVAPHDEALGGDRE